MEKTGFSKSIQPSGIHPASEGLPPSRESRAFTFFRKVQEAMRYIPDFADTCKAILDVVIDEIDAENCSLMLKDPKSGELYVRAARGKDEKKSVYYADNGNNGGNSHGKRFKAGEGIAGWVLKQGREKVLNDVEKEPLFVGVPGSRDNVKSLICFPVKEKEQVVGVFNLSHSRKGAFDEGDQMVLSYIANQMGIALTSARLFLEMQEMNHPPGTSAPAFSTLIEVGELTSRNGIFLYASGKMHRIKEIIDQVANTDVTVLIQGESGVGKEVVARSIHLNSSRKDKPFIKVNCAALPQDLLESELFGYEKGAFTGAYRQKPGKFELAEGGTIFLDEIVEMAPSLQAKLLQVLQDREFSRLGGKQDIHVDVRVLAATNRNIEVSIEKGEFRDDLYYRMNVVNITLPPLRDRKEEISIFVEYFMEKFQKKYNKTARPVCDRMMEAFLQYSWPGNVRELENVIHRYVVLGNEEKIISELNFLPNGDPSIEGKEITFCKKKDWPTLKQVRQDAMMKAESEIIRKTLNQTHWNRKKAAIALNISYKALLYKIKACGLEEQPYL